MPTLTDTEFKAKNDVLSTHKMKLVRYTGPSAYVAGGDPLAASDLGWNTIDALVPCGVAWNGSAVRLVAWDATNQKLVWYVPNTGSEATGDLSAYSVVLAVFGQG